MTSSQLYSKTLIYKHKGNILMSKETSIVRQDINFLENPLWSPDRKDNKPIYKVTNKNGTYTFIAMPDNIPDDTDAMFLYYFLLLAQNSKSLKLELNTSSVLKDLKIQKSKRNYERLYTALERWKQASINFEGSFFKKEKDGSGEKRKVYTTEGFHFLEYKVNKKRVNKRRRHTFIVEINHRFFKAIEDTAFVNYININNFIDAKTPLNRRLYEWLPKQFIGRDVYRIGHIKLLEKLRITCPQYPSKIKRKLRSIQRSVERMSQLDDHYFYDMTYERKADAHTKVAFMITFNRTKKAPCKSTTEIKNNELQERLSKYFIQSNENIQWILNEVDEVEITSSLSYIEDRYNRGDVKDIGAYTWAFFQKGYYTNIKSLFDIEKQEMKQKREQEERDHEILKQLENDFLTFKREKTEQALKSLSKDKMGALKKKFVQEDVEDNEVLKIEYNHKKFKSASVRMFFRYYAEKILLKDDEQNFVLYAKDQNYNIQKKDKGYEVIHEKRI